MTEPTFVDEHNEYAPPTLGVGARTLVFDADEQRQVLWLEGQHPLPTGTYIELYDPVRFVHGEAIVQRVRVLAAAGDVPATLCLDCTVTRWWEELLKKGLAV